MRVAIEIGPVGQSQADARGVLVAQPVENVEPPLSELATTGELRGERGEAVLFHAEGTRLVAVGVGKRTEVDRDALRTAGAAAAHALARVGGTLAWQLDESLPLPLPEQAAAVVEGTILGGYTPGRWKTKDDARPKQVDRIAFESDGVRDAAERAALLAERTNRARDLANMPPNELYPETLAQQASALADEHDHLTATALGPKEMEELGMGALLAVGVGSHNQPRLIVLRYEPPAARDDLVLGLVGKAITFDAGGIS